MSADQCGSEYPRVQAGEVEYPSLVTGWGDPSESWL
jgi:hypothetical protein